MGARFNKLTMMHNSTKRIALCFRGLADGKSKGSTVEAFSDSRKEIWKSLNHLIQGNNFDVFCHSWSTEVTDLILDIYNPKKRIIEKQKIFQNGYKIGMDNAPTKPERRLTQEKWIQHVNKSQLYSITATLELKNQYEAESDIVYDAVFVLRYDQRFYEDFDYEFLHGGNKIVTPCLPYKHENPASKINNARKFPYLGRKLWDTWWVSDSRNIDNIMDAYYKLQESNYKINGMHKFWDHYFGSINQSTCRIATYPRRISHLCRNFHGNEPIDSTLHPWGWVQ